MAGAIILLDTTHKKEKDIINRYKDIEEIKEAHIVYGSYDILLKLIVNDLKQLRVITQEIRGDPDVNLTQTFLYSEEKTKKAENINKNEE